MKGRRAPCRLLGKRCFQAEARAGAKALRQSVLSLWTLEGQEPFLRKDMREILGGQIT